ncbi:Sec-independent protein translocase protein TatE [Sodalis praecaptivus]
MEGLSITKLLVVGALIVLLFGTKSCARWAATWVRPLKALKGHER